MQRFSEFNASLDAGYSAGQARFLKLGLNEFHVHRVVFQVQNMDWLVHLRYFLSRT
jgi:hypothetical protein